MSELQLTINGHKHRLEIPPNRSLAEVLRYDLKLTGTKVGCGEAECGSCTVSVDGRTVNSCIYPAQKADGCRVTTIEGLAQSRGAAGTTGNTAGTEILHPLQQAFVDHGATQCGFCTSGILMQAASLLEQNPDPSTEAIRHSLKDTLCRCTGYTSIINAVKDAAGRLRGEEPATPDLPEVVRPMTSVGRPLPRPDAVQKVTGTAVFADDLAFPGMLWGSTVRSEHPHARIRSIRTDRARTAPGVAAVFTADDIPGNPRHGLVETDWPVFAGGEYPARYYGDPVALVVAERPEQARAARDLVEIDYEILPAVVDPVEARSTEAPVLHPDRPEGNLLKHIKVRHGDVEAGFENADVVVERTYRTPRTEHAFMEPECSLAVPAGYDDNHSKLTIYVGSQIPYSDRKQVAASLGLEESAVRVRGTVMGGGFGGKEDIAAQIHAALAAGNLNRPVKILYDREESLRFHPKRHATIIRLKTGASKDGRLVAVQAELYGDSGAYASLGEKVMTRATTHATGPYAVENARIDCYAMYTNNAPCGAFRGFGVTQSAFAVESNMDQVAEQLGMDPLEFRRKNAMKVGTTTATGQLLRESVGLLECLDRVEGEIRRWKAENAPESADLWAPVERGSRRLAWGLAAGYKNTGLGGGAPDKSTAEVELFPDGSAEVRTSSAEMGQNLVGVLAACVSEELGLPFDKVRVLVMDTDLTPDGGPTTASRQTFVSGNAARLAARNIADRLKEVLSLSRGWDAGSIRLEDGRVFSDRSGPETAERSTGSGSPGSAESLSFGQAVDLLIASGEPPRVKHEYEAPETLPLGSGGDMHFAFSYAVHAALVSVDTETGEVAVEKVAAAHDVGRAINPLSLTGQLEGGIVMGLGNALTEHYIEENGIPWTRHLGQYTMPKITMVPEMINHIVEHAVDAGPYGAKGVGEISSIPISPAIASAVYHAVGIRALALPLDQDALLLAMKKNKRELRSRWGDAPDD